MSGKRPKAKHWIEHIGLLIFHGICKIVPYPYSSRLFGNLAAFLGSRMAMNRKAKRHIMNALQCDEDQAGTIAKGMWENLGRMMAEFPHLQTIAANHVKFNNIERLYALRDDGQGGVLFGAHLGNWEIIPHALLYHANLAMHPVYRAPNNKLVDKRLHRYRAPDGRLIPYSKSRQGMAGMVKALKSGEHLGLLIDQKYNEGVDALFFGLPAKTGTAFIELSQKYKCPLVPVRCIRNGNDFIIDVGEPISTQDRDTMDVLGEAHMLLEEWIKEYPPQWLWLHRRWKNKD